MCTKRTADVIVPVFRNSSTLIDLLDDLSSLREKMDAEADIDLKAIFVVDGCPDLSEEILLREKNRPIVSQIHVLEKNVGALQAVRFGMRESAADVSVVCSADRQEPLELIESLIHEALASGWISCGIRRSRVDGNLSSSIFWKFSRKYIYPEIPEHGIDVFALARGARDLVMRNTSRDHPITFLLYQFRRPPVSVPYDRKVVDVSRQSGWTFRSKLGYAIDVVFAFSELPMKCAYRLSFLNVLLLTILVVFNGFWIVNFGFSALLDSMSMVLIGAIALNTTLILMIGLAYIRQIFLERNSESTYLSWRPYSELHDL